MKKYKKMFQDSLSWDDFKIQGHLSGNASQLIQPGRPGVFNYNVSANIQISFRGLSIPITYSITNGRTISRFGAPPIKIPEFKTFGLSPKWGDVTFHFGNRSMDFSKYTFSGIRFNGLGIETKEEGLYLKAFNGDLKYLNPFYYLYNTNIPETYSRRAWGIKTGYHSDNYSVYGVVFKADDQYSVFNDSSMYDHSPKENTVLSFGGQLQLYENITFDFDHSLSALTRNAFEDRVEILTHQTVYNMLGLFQRKPSSNYKNAYNLKLSYTLEEYSFGFTHEFIENGYKSLGTLLFDNNFRDYKAFYNSTLFEKLSVNLDAGMREQLEAFGEDNDKRFIMNSSLHYSHNDKLSFNGSYSNFKTVQHTFFRSSNSSEADSLILTQTTQNISLGSTYNVKDSINSAFGLMIVNQRGLTVKGDNVSNNQTNTNMLSMNYSCQIDKHSLNTNITYNHTKTHHSITKMLSFAVNYNYMVTKKLSSSFNTNYTNIQFNQEVVNQLRTTNRLSYKYNDHISLNFDMSIELSDQDDYLKLNSLQLQTNASFTF